MKSTFQSLFRHPIAVFMAIGILFSACGQEKTYETGFLERTAVIGADSSKYQIYVPPGYTEDSEWPVILFLHGAGERGVDGAQQTEVGIGAAIKQFVDRWPAIVVLPQVPEEQTWQGLPGEFAMLALDSTMETYKADSKRVYLTGLSMGGNGTWYLGNKFPDRFAALVPICAYVSGFDPYFPSIYPENEGDRYTMLAQSVLSVPTWIVHGDADSVVSVEESRKMVEAFSSLGIKVNYTELPGVGHNAWDAAYADSSLVTWLFSQKKD